VLFCVLFVFVLFYVLFVFVLFCVLFVFVLFYVLFVFVLFYILFVFVLFCVLFVFVLFYVLFVFLLFYVLFVCKCVLYYCYRVLTQLQLTNISYHIIISGFRRGVNEIALLRCYAALNRSYLVTLRGSLSVPFSGIQKSKKAIKDGTANCPETSVNIHQFTRRSIQEE